MPAVGLLGPAALATGHVHVVAARALARLPACLARLPGLPGLPGSLAASATSRGIGVGRGIEVGINEVLLDPLGVEEGSGLILGPQEHGGGVDGRSREATAPASLLAALTGSLASAATSLGTRDKLGDIRDSLVEHGGSSAVMDIRGDGLERGGQISGASAMDSTTAFTTATSAMELLIHLGEVGALFERVIASSLPTTVGLAALATLATGHAEDSLQIVQELHYF